MNTEELKNMIQLYFDGELEKNKEPLLFTSIAQNSEAREYFKSMNLLKYSVEDTEEEFPQELEERIFYSLKYKQINKRGFTNSPAVRIISYSIVAILIIVNIYLLGRISSYNEKMNNVETIVQKQNQVIELLYNSIPAAEVKAEWENEIIIKANL
jgi:hypothetical protein